MKAGDLVKFKGDWVKVNPWMKGTELDDSSEECGVIIEVIFWQAVKCTVYKGLWHDGIISDWYANDLEVVCK